MLVDLPDRRVVIVLGYTVTRADGEFVVTTRTGTERNRIPILTSATTNIVND